MLSSLERVGVVAKSRGHVLLSVLAERRLMAGDHAELGALMQDVLEPPISQIGALSVNAFPKKNERTSLVGQGAVPFGTFGSTVAPPPTPSDQLALGMGQLAGALTTLINAGELAGGGALLSLTGVGAIPGVATEVVATTMVVGAAVNAVAGVYNMAAGKLAGGGAKAGPAASESGSGGKPSRSSVMEKAQLPHRGGLARYVPPDNWNATEPLPRGPQSGYIDNKGNEWVRGPSRTAGQPFEWDVQLPDGRHLNVSLDGEITHGLNLNGKTTWP